MKGSRLYLALLSLLVLLSVSCSPKEIRYKAGQYEGEGDGHHGPIGVQVTVDQYKIIAIDIVEQQETPVLSDVVYERLPQKVIKKNTTQVDVIAGATFTSEGLLQAIENGLEKARVNSETGLEKLTD